MRSSIKRLIFALAIVSLARSPAFAQTATFDDLVGGPPVPPGYALAGSIWNNIYVWNKASTYPAGKDACAVSNPNCVANGGGALSSISRASPFNFTGGYFLGWADYSCGAPSTPESFNCVMNLTVTGYNGGVVVGSSTVSLAPYATQWYAFNLSSVDLVTFDMQASNGGAAAWYLGDNFVFSETNAVPEPGSMALLGTGLVGLYGAIRRRRENQV
jgi:hypothetical protein